MPVLTAFVDEFESNKPVVSAPELVLVIVALPEARVPVVVMALAWKSHSEAESS